jgi:hypothetical protein
MVLAFQRGGVALGHEPGPPGYSSSPSGVSLSVLLKVLKEEEDKAQEKAQDECERLEAIRALDELAERSRIETLLNGIETDLLQAVWEVLIVGRPPEGEFTPLEMMVIGAVANRLEAPSGQRPEQ